MKKIKIINMALDNFKGIRHYEFNLDGHDASVYGANGSGKTTLVDAWSWICFGKDSHGSADFNIKPLDSSGEVRDHGVTTSVAAVIDIDGKRVSLRREYAEKWSRKRGKPDATYDGNVTSFYIDDVPLKMNEYIDKVSEMVAPEATFALLTRLYGFSESLSWQQRRNVLFSMGGALSDKELMLADDKFTELAAELGDGTMDDLKRRLQSQRKLLASNLNSIPKRVDEVAQLLDSLKGLDFTGIDERQSAAEAKKTEAMERLARLTNGSELTKAAALVTETEAALKSLESENREYRAEQLAAANAPNPKLTAAEKQRREVGWAYDQAKKELGQLEEHIAELTVKIEDCRKNYKAVYSKKIPDDEIRCPTCGREYDAAARASAAAAFEAAKKEQLTKITDEGVKLSNMLTSSKEAHNAASEKAEQLEATIEANDKLLAELEKEKTAPVITDMPDYQTRRDELTAKLDAAKAEYNTAAGNIEAAKAAILAEVEAAGRELSVISDLAAKRGLKKQLLDRRDKLESERFDLAVKQEHIDRLLYLADEFARHKVAAIEDSINAHFKLARWKLFDVQVNGAIADCCEATYNGVPYSDVNSAMRANLGVDIISAISAHYGLSVPLFCDNAESVSEYQPIDTQVIKLYVAPECGELKVEVK